MPAEAQAERGSARAAGSGRGRRRTVIALLSLAALLGLGLLAWNELPPEAWAALRGAAEALFDRERVAELVAASGWAAPLVLVGLHLVQVLIAPIPGDAFCILGGYLFGVWKGFLLSTAGMTLGSAANFLIGRLFGERVVRRLMSCERFAKLDALVRDRGLMVIFLCYLVPGSPKDTLCLLLGMTTTLPLHVMLVVSAAGRLPTTLAFSLQGAAFFRQDSAALIAAGGACVALGAAAWLGRRAIARWVGRQDGKKTCGTLF